MTWQYGPAYGEGPWLSSTDGFVRLSLDAMLDLRLEHMLSRLEQDPQDIARCGAQTAICGYSEWFSRAAPCLSIGWDWRLVCAPGVLGLARVGWPRSNVMLIDRHGADYAWRRNLEVLGTVVDALPWRDNPRQVLLRCTL
ncbi:MULTISPECIES: DUF4902 domain-containing protein [Comamonadaceae]|jgi:hypothetical protein|uniref:DUF4902 domain-containing protein n=3 Tax=cellular organisms TaxID=131567 RepID=A0A420RME5_GIBIN|nr:MULTISPECIES: DUF4902 domain-containing protein [Comamonadaceae]OJX31518.1 MAG: hypothetical protein BGO74_06205 [Burkholderiales bacterium 68-12]RKL18217.1 hypothetical protein BFJ72_g15238 [Fusarium proliferatum]GAO20846.1 hypothetical protein ALISP_0666 [Alicycliphilus sp. B1]MDR7092903.1 hypothetical protein [Hydrogenophaga laconesensis]NCU65522.1 DUF4902 domain-containing protein [Acidovorax sp. 210-6]